MKNKASKERSNPTQHSMAKKNQEKTTILRQITQSLQKLAGRNAGRRSRNRTAPCRQTY